MPRFDEAMIEQSVGPAWRNRLERVLRVGANEASLSIGNLTTVVDVQDAALLRAYRWHFTRNESGGYYARTTVATKPIYLHRLITEAPTGKVVDHCDHNGLNNRRANLRVTTNQQNMVNRRGPNKNSSTGIRGVSAHRCRPTGIMYVARFHHPGGRLYGVRYFPFSVDGLIRAAEKMAEYLALSPTYEVRVPSLAEAEVIHLRLSRKYADSFRGRVKRPQSAVPA